MGWLVRQRDNCKRTDNDVWMDGWVDGWMDGYRYRYSHN